MHEQIKRRLHYSHSQMQESANRGKSYHKNLHFYQIVGAVASFAVGIAFNQYWVGLEVNHLADQTVALVSVQKNIHPDVVRSASSAKINSVAFVEDIQTLLIQSNDKPNGFDY